MNKELVRVYLNGCGNDASEQCAIDFRDECAMRAMQAAATNPTGADGFTFDQRAEWAYSQADAMIKARAKS